MSDPCLLPSAARRRPHALDNRRQNRSERFVWPAGGHAYVLTAGFRDSGAVREIFISGHREGSDIQGLIDDACVAASLALQMGVAAVTLARHLGRQGAQPSAGAGGAAGAQQNTFLAASVLGEAVRRAAAIEAEEGREIAALARVFRKQSSEDRGQKEGQHETDI